MPICTENKIGDLCTSEIDAAMSSCSVALEEFVHWGPGSGAAVLEQGLGCYSIPLDKLRSLKPDVILTQLQGVGGSVCAQLYLSALKVGVIDHHVSCPDARVFASRATRCCVDILYTSACLKSHLPLASFATVVPQT